MLQNHNQRQYRVLVVDDSAFMRQVISGIIDSHPDFVVAGTARNGKDAVAKVLSLRPDVVTMDVEMPEMDGVQAVREIMHVCPVPVIMLSSHTADGARITLQALEVGAVDFFLKDDALKRPNHPQVQLFQRLAIAAEANLQTKLGARAQTAATAKPGTSSTRRKAGVVFIGCSTGGPAALQSILPHFSRSLNVPVVIVQHMPVGFTTHLAERFNRSCPFPVQEAKDGETVRSGVAYVAPAGMQTTVIARDGRKVFQVTESSRTDNVYRPSVDVSLQSVASAWKDATLAVILTGMGRDGVRGCEAVKRLGGTVLVEAPETCVVYGMPKAVKDAGYADAQLPLDMMAERILQHL